jgi:hypothetical protein
MELWSYGAESGQEITTVTEYRGDLNSRAFRVKHAPLCPSNQTALPTITRPWTHSGVDTTALATSLRLHSR